MKVAKIEYSGKADVYNMEVEETHDFIANGIVVHNCYDEWRYVCMARPMNPPAAEAPKERPYDPLDTNDNYYDKYAFFKKY